MMMMLDGFIFELYTAAFQEINRKTAQRWVSQARVGKPSMHQYLGPGDDNITLPGTIYPELCGPDAKLSLTQLRSMADKGKPYILIADAGGAGVVLGQWFIDSIDDDRSEFLHGSAQKIDFTVHLTKYPED